MWVADHVHTRLGRELALDLYLYWSGKLDEEALAAEIAAALARPDFPQDLRRIAVCLARPEGVHCFTFRQGPQGGYEEDGLTRGLHPMIAQRFIAGNAASASSARFGARNANSSGIGTSTTR